MTALNNIELSEIQGGDIVTTVDTACAVVGVGSLFIPGAQGAAAFCAGWTVGRLVGSWM